MAAIINTKLNLLRQLAWFKKQKLECISISSVGLENKEIT